MKRICVTFICALLAISGTFSQTEDYTLVSLNADNPSAFRFTIKTFAKKKKSADWEAQSAAIRILLFDGIPDGRYATPLLASNAKRVCAEYLSDLYNNRISDFIRYCKALSEFQKADVSEKSTLYEVGVDFNLLKNDVETMLINSGVTVDVVQSFSNQKKPTLMILPSDNWCSLRLYTTTYDNQGTKQKVPNYAQAFQDDMELGAVISKVGGLLTGLGYSLKDAEQLLKTMNDRQAEDNITVSKNRGASIEETPLDNLKKRAKADILIQIWWKVNKEGAAKSVSFTLEAFDAYTSKRIGTSSGTGAASQEIVPVLLENAVRSHISDFDAQMVTFYEDINRNGREITLNIKKWDDWDNDLESDYNGATLLDIIEDWLHEHTVNDSFNLSDATENFALFEQVRIPLVNASGRAMDARGFVSGLQRHLKNTYGIPAKLMIRGLGEANLILGEQ